MVVEDLVHQAVQAAAVAGHAHVVADHQAVHAVHAAEASLVVDVPSRNHQRAAVAQSQSKFFTSIEQHFGISLVFYSY